MDGVADNEPNYRLTLFHGWRLTTSDRTLVISRRGQRLLALLALRGPRTRSALAGTLWPEHTEARARASLRSTLTRLRTDAPGAVLSQASILQLACVVTSDVADLRHLVGTLHSGRGPEDLTEALSMLSNAELLPEFDEEWLDMEREHLRMDRVHSLDQLGRLALHRDEHAVAIGAATAAIEIEALRETPRQILIEAHLAVGNLAAALTTYQDFTALLELELGVAPSRRLLELFDDGQIIGSNDGRGGGGRGTGSLTRQLRLPRPRRPRD